ncbi:MAG: tRNA (adenosine(37)-N6)-threonylcarbamoyltransferase complex transferase subunit TsaD [Desulfobacterales bacterium]|nr:tRNA (adenosine(37)-N6)-threonylcarbamoyltransferase complex transferase subunit TsaD [Desulfobacterales bacterium]
MIILGIDTSCDDTSAGVIENGKKAMSNIVHSQVELHHPHGGVVPELASREHLRNIMPVVRESLLKADLEMKDLDGVAVTVGPGLVGSLLVGLYYAKGLSYVYDLPLMAINHLEGHILSIFLEEEAPAFPFVALTVSGGHTSLYDVKGYGQYVQMGQTLDDAAGEAFDKVAKVLGLGYPGGPVIEKAALGGQKDRIKFPRAYLSKDSLDFSFSGLKTAVALYVEKWHNRRVENSGITRADIAASFQESVVDVLVNKVMKASKKLGYKTVVIAGGVACNNRLRERLFEVASNEGTQVYYPRPAYCTDNGAMIAVAGYHRALDGQGVDLSMDVRSKYPIQDLQAIDSFQD